MKNRNRFFDKILRESFDDYGISGQNDNNVEIDVPMSIIDEPLNALFSDVLAASQKENVLTYSNLTVSKKSIPISQLNQIFDEVYGESENTLDDTDISLNERSTHRNKTRYSSMSRNRIL
jgi:hypothetical protein